MSELKQWRYVHQVPANVWAVYLKQDNLEQFVESIGWAAIRAAKYDGVHKVRDVKFFIDPANNEEFQTVEVTLLYVSSL